MKNEVELYNCTWNPVSCAGKKQPAAYLKAPLKHVITQELNQVIVIDQIATFFQRRRDQRQKETGISSVSTHGTTQSVPAPQRSMERANKYINTALILTSRQIQDWDLYNYIWSSYGLPWTVSNPNTCMHYSPNMLVFRTWNQHVQVFDIWTYNFLIWVQLFCML